MTVMPNLSFERDRRQAALAGGPSTQTLEGFHLTQLRPIFFVVLLLLCQVAKGDWEDHRAVLLCDKENHVLSIKSVIETSDHVNDIHAPPGHEPLTTDSNYSCVLGATRIRANFEVRDPFPSGACSGMTRTYIRSLKVNGKEQIHQLTKFNSPCLSEPVLYDLEVTEKRGKPYLKKCIAPWDWDQGYKAAGCHEFAL
jgi:hypothetical protein